MSFINLDATQEDRRLAYEIAKRATHQANELGFEYDLLTAEMDIIATHLNGCPLKLQELLDADDDNFLHDVFGIRRHLNRQTGALENFFDPRYSQPEGQ
jgi:uncharacterized protein DUF6874